MVFILSTLWWIRIRGLWKIPDGRDWLRWKLGLVLMGRSVLCKSLIQFSVNVQCCACCLTWGQTMLEMVKIVETSFKRSVHTLLYSVIKLYIYIYIYMFFLYIFFSVMVYPVNPHSSDMRLVNPWARTWTQPKLRLGLEPMVFWLRSHAWFQDLMKLRFFISHHRKNSEAKW